MKFPPNLNFNGKSVTEKGPWSGFSLGHNCVCWWYHVTTTDKILLFLVDREWTLHSDIDPQWTLTHWGRDGMDIFKHIFFNESDEISINIPLKFVPMGPINNISALVQIMAWCHPGDKPSSEPMMVSLPMHICVNRPQWVSVTQEDTEIHRKFYHITFLICREYHYGYHNFRTLLVIYNLQSLNTMGTGWQILC